MPSLQTTQVSSASSYSQNIFTSDGVWRQGNLIVLQQGAILPGRCLRTNTSVSGPRKKVTLYWHSPWFFLLILVHIFVFLLVAMCVRKSITLEVAMSPEMIRRRNRLYRIGAAISLGGVIEFIIGALQGEQGALALFIGFTAFFVGIIVAAVGGQTLTIQRMEGNYVWLKGASPEYLNSLPEWRGFPPG